MAFSPTTISGCSLWLDANDSGTITATSNAVGTWTDKSGSGYNFSQATAGNKPVYTPNSVNGKATLAFTATNSQYLVGNAAANSFAVGTNCYALFVVCKFNNSTSTGAIINKASYAAVVAGRMSCYRDSGGLSTFLAHSTTSYVTAQTYNFDSASGYRILSLICNRVQGVDTFYINGVSVSSLTYTSDISTALSNTFTYIIGGYNDTTGGVNPPTVGYFLDGNIAEIITYSKPGDMTDVDRQKIEDYLGVKWGIYSGFDISNNDSGGIYKDANQVWDICANFVNTQATEIGFLANGLDLSRIFVLYASLSSGGYTGVTGANCNFMDSSGYDIGPYFVKKGTLQSLLPVVASGTYTKLQQNGYDFYIFTDTGSLSFNNVQTVIKILAVGGGGAGGNTLVINIAGAGGGGGGGVVTTTKAITQTTSLSIAIGNGGTAKTGFISYLYNGNNGGTTYGTFNNGIAAVIAGGGGGGGLSSIDPIIVKSGSNGSADGGSGGGNGLETTATGVSSGITQNSNLANNGGQKTSTGGGGGGGAGAQSSNGIGGDGYQWLLRNSTTNNYYYWGGGGGGGIQSSASTYNGGKGGGGSSTGDSLGYGTSTVNGGANTGGGGAGNSNYTVNYPGNGGSGVFIVAVDTITTTGSPTMTLPLSGGRLYTFAGNGTITFGVSCNVQVLLVGGGGGGGMNGIQNYGSFPAMFGGGGGGGCVGTINYSITNSNTTLSIVIGGGGRNNGSNGGNTSVTDSNGTTTVGGGGGGGNGSEDYLNDYGWARITIATNGNSASNGGCGGGGGGYNGMSDNSSAGTGGTGHTNGSTGSPFYGGNGGGYGGVGDGDKTGLSVTIGGNTAIYGVGGSGSSGGASGYGGGGGSQNYGNPGVCLIYVY